MRKNDRITSYDVAMLLIFIIVVITSLIVLSSCIQFYGLEDNEPDQVSIIQPLKQVCEVNDYVRFTEYELEHIEIPNEEEVAEEYLIDVTDEEIELMARVVMSESSVLDFDAKVATAQTIVNRVRSNHKEFKYQKSVSNVVKPGQFSTQDNGKVTDECYEAVYIALTEETYPTDMLWFCKSKYGYGNNYIDFGKGKRKTYFSTVADYNE